MALRPIIVVGCGGSGGKVVVGLRRRLNEELVRRGWEAGIPDAFQLRWIDVPADPEEYPNFGSPLPAGDYIPLSKGPRYADYDAALVYRAGNDRIDRLSGWRPTPHLELPVTEGAGQMRAVGRGVALANATAMAEALRESIGKAKAGRPTLDLLANKLRGGSGEPRANPEGGVAPFVIVVSSLAGGTGAGIFMDVCDLLRASDPDLSGRIFGVLFTAEVFRDVKADTGMPSNTVAALSELMSGYLSIGRSPESLFGLVGSHAATGASGPSYPFIVGLQPLGGGEALSSPNECYRAVTETILATMLDEQLQQSFLAHEVTNFIPNSGQLARQTAFSMFNESPGSNVPARCGVVSSFGSAKVSVGSARFGEWARKRMARSVVDYVVSGWKDRGLELLDETQRETATDQEIIDFLVTRDREIFFEQCGLWEENEPDGTEHNQVLDSILTTEALGRLSTEFRTAIVGELQAGGNRTGIRWVEAIGEALRMREKKFASAVKEALDAGVAHSADKLVPALSNAVSDWLARFGLPVTAGLVRATREQCQSASAQLLEEAAQAGAQAANDVTSSLTAAFQALGNGQCPAGSDFVATALRRAMGPMSWRGMRTRSETASGLLSEFIVKVLDPLISELDQVGKDLTHPTFVQQVNNWPDGGGVAPVYAPPPSEFCLVPAENWNSKYQQLLGSVELVRDQIAAGGFAYGPVSARVDAPVAVQMSVSKEGWLGRDAHKVTVKLALRPEDVLDRTKMWMGDENNAMGRFLSTGLAEYLSRQQREGLIEDHLARKDQFRIALAGALAMAKPLFRVVDPVMQAIHPGKSLEVTLSVQKFPFDPEHPAREIVDSVLFSAEQPSDGWCSENGNDGVESVLLMSRLSSAIHPAAVASLYQPIARHWNEVVSQGRSPTAAVDGFWTYNRARLLTESIPLPQPSVDAMVRGWFVGRLLGLITAPTMQESMTIRGQDEFSAPKVAVFPWPLLRNGKNTRLHQESSRLEWLPALLEHLGLAMMLVSQNQHILDGYEMLFRLGLDSSDVLDTFIDSGDTPAGRDVATQVVGSSPDERKESVIGALTSLIQTFDQRILETKAKLVPHYETFVDVPFGYELMPLFRAQLSTMKTQVSNKVLHDDKKPTFG